MYINFAETSKILDNLYLVDVRIGFPTGTVSGSEDLVAANDKEIVRVGLQIFDPKLTRPFSAARQKVKRVCTALGSSFLGGYAIPTEHIKEFRDTVAEIGESYNAAKMVFLDNLVEKNRQWAETHPELKSVILARCPTHADAERAFKFAISACKVMPPEPESVAHTEDNHLFEEVSGLGVQIAREIAQDVQDSWVSTGKTTQKVVGLIRRCRKKAHGLAFVHHKLASLVSTIDQVLDELPASGPIEGVQYLKVVGLLRMLSDPVQILGNQQVIYDEPEATAEAASHQDEDSSARDDDDVAVEVTRVIRRQPETHRVAWMMF